MSGSSPGATVSWNLKRNSFLSDIEYPSIYRTSLSASLSTPVMTIETDCSLGVQAKKAKAHNIKTIINSVDVISVRFIYSTSSTVL